MLTLFSPAKLNLFFKVLNKRDDGYHNIASLFQAVSLGDTLHFSLEDSDSLRIVGPLSKGILPDKTNLISQAVDVFRKKTGISFGVSIVLEKNVPIQAGLGGGNSNAATTLWALNELLGSPASLQDLITWSAEIGSDTTFFLSLGTAFCTGRGEIIELLPKLKEPENLYIFKPSFGLSTPTVFSNLDISRLPPSDHETAKNMFLNGSASYFNDLEMSAFVIEPRLLSLKQNLEEAGFASVTMTGSGTSLFAIGSGVENFDDLLFNDPLLHCFPVKFIRREAYKWYTASNFQPERKDRLI